MQIKALNQCKCEEVDLADQCNDKGGKGGDQKKMSRRSRLISR